MKYLLLSLLTTLSLHHGAWAASAHAVFFDIGSDRLSEADRAVIEDVARSSDGSFVVIGRTDDTGSSRVNELLAQRRAEAVRRVLIEAGVSPERIEVVARPATGPLSGDKRGWRRVDIEVSSEGEERPASPTEVDPLRVGRYSVIAPVPTPAQRNPMSTIVRVRFPDDVRRVGQALDYLLARSGWRLPETEEGGSLHALSTFSLPESQRHLGPMPLIDAVAVLCGPIYDVVLDPLHRLVSCELKPDFSSLYEAL